jgi:hypothetical protein
MSDAHKEAIETLVAAIALLNDACGRLAILGSDGLDVVGSEGFEQLRTLHGLGLEAQGATNEIINKTLRRIGELQAEEITDSGT